MKKLIRFFLVFCMVLGIATRPAYATGMEDYYGAMTETKSDKDTAIEYGESYMQQFGLMDETTAEFYKDNTSGFIQEAMETYYSYVENDSLGKFVEIKKTTAKEADNGIDVVVEAKYEKANLTMTVTCRYIGGVINPVGISFSMEATDTVPMSEKLKNAALNTVMGLVTVFFVLILIAYIISLLKYIPGIIDKFSKKDENTSVKAENIPNVTEPSVVANEEVVDDTELVAVITAAICASEQISSDGFVVRSIRKVSRR